MRRHLKAKLAYYNRHSPPPYLLFYLLYSRCGLYIRKCYTASLAKAYCYNLRCRLKSESLEMWRCCHHIEIVTGFISITHKGAGDFEAKDCGEKNSLYIPINTVISVVFL